MTRVLLIVVLRCVANNCYSPCGPGIADRDADPGAAATFDVIVCDTDVATSQTDTHDIQAWCAHGMANIGIDFTFICGGKVCDATIGNARTRGSDAVVIQSIVVNREVIPKGQVDQIEWVRRIRSDEVVMNVGSRGTYDTSP